MDEVQIILDDQLIKCQALRASPYLGPFESNFKVRSITNFDFKFQDISILSSLDEIFILLDDHVLKCMTMKGSVHLKYIEKRFKVQKPRLRFLHDPNQNNQIKIHDL